MHASLRATGLHRSDQFAVWEGIEERIRGLEDRPPTSRMHALYEEDRESLEEAQRRLPWPAGACVVVAAIDGRIVCADLFDSPSPGTAASALPTAEKVSRFLYLPPDTPRGDLRLPRDRPEPALSHPGPGGQRPGLEEVVVHLEVIPSNGQAREAHGHTRMAGPSQRGLRG